MSYSRPPKRLSDRPATAPSACMGRTYTRFTVSCRKKPTVMSFHCWDPDTRLNGQPFANALLKPVDFLSLGSVNIEAMRELANVSAHSVIRTCQKRQCGAAFVWKILAGGFLLFTGVIAIFVGHWGSLWTIAVVTSSFVLAIYLFVENLVRSFVFNMPCPQKRIQVVTSDHAVAAEDDLTNSADQGILGKEVGQSEVEGEICILLDGLNNE